MPKRVVEPTPLLLLLQLSPPPPSHRRRSNPEPGITRGLHAATHHQLRPAEPVEKRPRKNLAMYDGYRMVRLPSATWDRKTVPLGDGPPWRLSPLEIIPLGDHPLSNHPTSDSPPPMTTSSSSACCSTTSPSFACVPMHLLGVLDGTAEDEELGYWRWGRLEVVHRWLEGGL